MTVTYDPTTIVGKIRLAIGDRDITNAVFNNEELLVFYAAEGSINLAAAMALEAWAASYAANADSEGIGDYRYTQSIVDRMLNLAKRLRETEAGVIALGIASMDLTAGSAITEESD